MLCDAGPPTIKPSTSIKPLPRRARNWGGQPRGWDGLLITRNHPVVVARLVRHERLGEDVALAVGCHAHVGEEHIVEVQLHREGRGATCRTRGTRRALVHQQDSMCKEHRAESARLPQALHLEQRAADGRRLHPATLPLLAGVHLSFHLACRREGQLAGDDSRHVFGEDAVRRNDRDGLALGEDGDVSNVRREHVAVE
eukprot:272762-Prymnesium_polylepis.2